MDTLTITTAFGVAALAAVIIKTMHTARRVSRTYRSDPSLMADSRYSRSWLGADGRRWRWDTVRHREVPAT